MNEALDLIYYTLSKFYYFVFGSYIFEGVSIGMIWVVCFIFTVLLTFLLAVPRVPLRFGSSSRSKSRDSSDRPQKSSSSSN